MKSGFLIINKDRGVTSTKAVTVLKHLLRPKKIGHAGTLDPLAEGVLVVAVNEATKVIRFVENSIKEYEFDVIFGVETATCDMEGEIINTSNKRPELSEIKRIIPEFIGKIKQVPPKYSAIKINGKRAYDLARKNIDFIMREREIIIESLDLISFDGEKARFKVVCHKGTYVRSLARDIALKLGTFGYVSYLRRNRIGKFLLSDAILLSKIENMVHNFESFIKPLSTMLDDILAFAVNGKEAADLLQGKKVKTLGTDSYNDVIITSNDKLVAIADINDGVITPKRIIFD